MKRYGYSVLRIIMATTNHGDGMNAFVPAVVFPPGDIIQDELDARGWTQADLAEVMGRPIQAINEIIKAKKRITEETARELEAAFGIDADIWLRNEALYRVSQVPSAPASISRRAALRRRAPLRAMLKRGWIRPGGEPELETQVKSLLGINDLTERASFAMAARQTIYGEPLTPVQEVWLARVRQVAKIVAVANYAEAKLEAAIEQFYPLLRSPDEVRHVPAILADAGVRFVVVEQLPGLKIQAVCTWLSDREPVIGMSMVRDSIDNFWFGVRHECEHVLNGDGKGDAPIIDTDLDSHDESSEPERIANRAAADFCVPQHLMDDFLNRKLGLISDADIRSFAHINARHSGLVAGQLRNRLNAFNKYTSHLARVRHIILTTATVDGFGTALDIA